MAKATKLSGLGPTTRLRDAAEHIIGVRLSDVRRFEDQFREKCDPDDVHDMRVATRRLRAAVQLVGVGTACDREVKRFQDALGDLRDLHVQLEWLEHREHGASDELTAAVDEMKRRFSEAVPSKEQRLREELERWTTQTVPLLRAEASGITDSHRLGGHVFRALLKKRLRQVERGMERFVQSSDALTAHRLRIRAKKLRYLAELLEVVWPDKIAALLQALAPLQDAFGHLHDADVRIAELSGLNESAPPGAGELLRAVEEERERLVGEASALVLRWRSEDLARDMRRMFKKSVPVGM